MKSDASPKARAWVEYLLLALITVLAALLRVHKLGEWSYFVDELHTWNDTLRYAQRPLSRLLYPNRQQLFWILTNQSLGWFSDKAVGLRFFPCLWGILTVPALYVPLRNLFDKRIALLSVLLLAISPWHIYMSQMARVYSILCLIGVLALYSFYVFVERNSVRHLVYYALLCYLALTLHMSAGFLLLIGLVYLACLLMFRQFRPEQFRIRRALILIFAAILCAPMVVMAFTQFMERWEGTKEAHGTFGKDIDLKLLYHITPVGAVIALAGVIALLRAKDRRGLFLALCCGVPIVLLTMGSELGINVATRYMLFILPFVLVAMSYFCVNVTDRLASDRALISVVLVLSVSAGFLQADYMYFGAYYGNRDRLREAIHFINDRKEDQDRFLPYLLHGTKDVFIFSTMASMEGLQVSDGALVTSRSVNDLDLSKRIWIVTRQNMTARDTDLAQWIVRRTHLLAEYRAGFGPEDYSIRVYLYAPNG